jgi:hypothetical protein
MQVPISQGLTGWTWDQNGNRTAVTGLTTPSGLRSTPCFARSAWLAPLPQRN